jgi:hypothetical protein
MGRAKRYRSFRIVASLLVLLALLGAPHKQPDDAACLPSLAGEHDASQHALAPVEPAHRDHCAICHWLRGLKPSFRVTQVDKVAMHTATDVVAPRAILWSDPSATRLPARAPPLMIL